MRLPLLSAVAAVAFAAQAPRIDPSKVVDLTYAFDENTAYWPTAKGFEWKKDVWGKRPDGGWYSSATFITSEHGGTHLDSPIHFGEGKWASHEIPVARFFGPARVIDITADCARDRNALLTPAHIAAYEKQYGPLREGDIVLVRTGWGRYWPNRKQYLGDDTPGDASHLSFPGIGPEAAKVLVARKVNGAGIDTASLDHGPSKTFPTHRVLNTSNIFGLENVANLERLPPAGALLIALPVKVRNGTGGPVRIVAVLP